VSPPQSKNESTSDDLQPLADSPQPGLLQEFWEFLRHSKKWWLLPILLALLLLGLLVVLSGTGLGPFIYPMM
jgi:hypothetical protein